MGKKESWFSAIKKAFISNSKQKIIDVPKKKSGKKKKWGLGKLRSHGEAASFIYREPSSIEKILGDAEKERQNERILGGESQRVENKLQPQVASDQSRKPYIPANPVTSHYNNASSPSAQRNTLSIPVRPTATQYNNAASPSYQQGTLSNPYRPIPTKSNNNKAPSYQQKTPSIPNPSVAIYSNKNTAPNYPSAATKIQAIYRGYMARKSFRAMKGLVRLRRVMGGQGVQRQTSNALKHMQLLVKVQSQIHSRRSNIHANQTLQHQNLGKFNNEFDSTLSRWAFLQTADISEGGNWDDSVLTKEERDERMQKKVDGIIKRERALAYANSKQWTNDPTKASQIALTGIRTGGIPRWWTWIERQLPNHSTNQATFQSPSLDLTMIPLQSSNLSFTPKSSKKPLAITSKTQISSPIPNLSLLKHENLRTNRFPFDTPLRDDESLTSCPPFSVPNYMAPTVSAKAKSRAYNSNPRENSIVTTPTSNSKRRLSLPLTQSIGSLRWSKFSTKGSPNNSERIIGKHKPTPSLSNYSVDSTTSLPVGVGRKPFNRFV